MIVLHRGKGRYVLRDIEIIVRVTSFQDYRLINKVNSGPKRLQGES